MENKIRFKVEDIEFEAEGTSEIVEQELNIFLKLVLPAVVESKTKTHMAERSDTYVDELKNMPIMKSIEIMDELAYFGDDREDIGSMSLAAYINSKGKLTEQDFTLFAAFFDELKNEKKFFTKNDVEKYYSDARRGSNTNISMSLNQLAKKGLIMDAKDIKKNSSKPYIITSEGKKYIRDYKKKTENEIKRVKSKNKHAEVNIEYKSITADDLNLSKYPAIKSLKKFKEKMMMILFIVTTENKGEWFGTSDVMFLMNQIFGQHATKDQINGVFRREKLWFKTEKADGSKKDVKRKLLKLGTDYAKSLMSVNSPVD